MSTPAHDLNGTLHIVPFDGQPLPNRISPIYSSLLDNDDTTARDILVLKRFPDAVPEFTAELRDAAGLESRPNVKSIARHATTVTNEALPEQTWLTYEQRIEFLAAVIENYNWSNFYAQSTEHDSFGSDIGQLLLDATWQGGFDISTDPNPYDEYLAELAAVNESFHEKLSARNLAEQADTVPQAIEGLADEEVQNQITQEFDIVLAVEFEEYSAVEREYLATLTQSTRLVCVGEEHASIDRVKKEAGDIRDFAGEMALVDHTSDPDADISIPSLANDMTGQPYGEFLATGSTTLTPRTPARLLTAETLDQQVLEVANEIEYLRYQHGWDYDDCIVLLRNVGDPMPRIRRVLQQAGIPTASAGVNGLEQDLAVRELHALAQYHIDESEQAFELLKARVPTVDDDLIEACVDPRSIAKSLKRWMVSTNLKNRIAEETSEIDAREQFQNISRLLTIAEFVDDQDFLAGDWFEFRTMLERAIAYDAPYAHTADVDVPEGGVTVGDVALVKDEARKAVFLLNVTDDEYPGSEPLSPLFPTSWIKHMTAYPAVTQPSETDLERTFQTASPESTTKFEEYHANRTRRQLAIGARAAEEQLYFCTYRSADSATTKPRHNSRYLHEIEAADDLDLEVVKGGGDDRDYYTMGSASASILAEPWAELKKVQAIASTGGTAELEDAEDRFAAIQKVLEESDEVSDRFRAAVHTQFDLARGKIRPPTEDISEEVGE